MAHLTRKTRYFGLSGQAWAGTGLALFLISTAFPVTASLVPASRLPAWIGALDVGLALVLVLWGFAMDRLAQERVNSVIVRASYAVYRALAALPLLLLGIFFLFGGQVQWNVLLPGLAWRAWLLLYLLPAGLALWREA
jgi:hypothetical protein